MTRVISILFLVSCAHGGMRHLYAPPQELSYDIDPACEIAYVGDKGVEPSEDVDCKEETRRGMTRRAQAGLFTEFGASDASIRLVILGDAGVRDPDDQSKVGAGPRAVHKHAKTVCGDTCDGVVMLGDNLYQHGVNDAVDAAFLRAYATLWADVGAQYYVPGNHDWGTFPVYKPPQLDRAQRQLGELRRLAKDGLDVRGDSHFWSTTVGDGRLVGLDTNYLVRACVLRGGDELSCAGDPRKPVDGRVSFRTMVDGLTAPGTGPTVVVGHHPWLSHGEHGEAGDYWDFNFLGPVALGRGDGEGLRFLFDEIIGPNAAIYLSGHDHNTQVARIDDATLSVVVGAGGKVTGPGKKTAEGGDRHLTGFELEHFCDLGYALLDLRRDRLVLQMHTLAAPTGSEDLAERHDKCVDHWHASRGKQALPQSPSCTEWTWTQTDGTVGTWSASKPCIAVE